jgi:hypothetical protein
MDEPQIGSKPLTPKRDGEEANNIIVGRETQEVKT